MAGALTVDTGIGVFDYAFPSDDEALHFLASGLGLGYIAESAVLNGEEVDLGSIEPNVYADEEAWIEKGELYSETTDPFGF